MKISTMRNIDRFLGTPVCLLMGFTKKFFFRHPVLNTERIHRILFIKFFGMGSIILATPAISAVRRQYPGASISFLSFEGHRELLECYPIIDQILTINASSFWKLILDALHFLRHCYRSPYDVVFDLEFFSKFSTILGSGAGAAAHVGFALPTTWRSLHLTHQIQLLKKNHVSEAFLDQVSLIIKPERVPNILPPQISNADDDAMFKKLPLNGKPIIAVNVNAGETFLERRWPPERFVELISLLAANSSCVFYFIGTNDEYEYIQEIIGHSEYKVRCYNIAGMLSIPQLAAFLLRSELLISNDSGPLHLAAALNVEVIGFYGPESPQFYGPLTEKSSIFYKQISCSPCMNIYSAKTFRCPYNARCMKEISSAEVVHSFRKEVLSR